MRWHALCCANGSPAPPSAPKKECDHDICEVTAVLFASHDIEDGSKRIVLTMLGMTL